MFTQLLMYNDFGLFALRAVVGVVFLYHGWPKAKNPQQMAAGLGWSKTQVLVLGLVEMASGLGLILGVLTQLAALLLAGVMVGAWYHKVVKWRTPFSAHDKMGWEYDLVLLGACLAILFSGGGLYVIG